MPSATAPSIVLSGVGLTWPDGTVALTGLSGTFSAGRTGLVGLNGSGKSTLLRLVAGELRPTTGSITTVGDVARLPQTLTLDVGARVADLLGIGAGLDAVRAIEAGDVDDRHFDTVGTDWDVEARAAEVLDSVGLPPEALDRNVGELSGGEAVLVAIAGLRLRAAPITLLDEPTNNLDRAARSRLGALVIAWRGALVVVSHDTSLLELVDETAELHDGALTVVAGPYSAYRARRGAAVGRRAGRAQR